MHARKRLRTILRYLLTALVMGVMLFPVYFMIASSLKSQKDIFAYPPSLIPLRPCLDSYREALFAVPFMEWVHNSLTVAVLVVGLSGVLASLAAYSLSRFRYPGRETISRAILLAYMFPSVCLVIPFFILMSKVHLTDSLVGLILAHTTKILPFSVWFLTAYVDAIPPELDEQALVDGCSRLGAFFRVVIPLTAPGLAAVTVFGFLVSWNEFLFAYILISSNSVRTLPLGIAAYFGAEFIPWGTILATTVLMSIPVFLFSFFAQRYLIMGLTAGATKG